MGEAGDSQRVRLGSAVAGGRQGAVVLEVQQADALLHEVREPHPMKLLQRLQSLMARKKKNKKKRGRPRRWNPGGTLAEPYLRAAPDHPGAYLG